MKAKISLMFMMTASLLLSGWTADGPFQLPACSGEVQRTGPLETVPPIPPRPEWNRFKILVWPYQTRVMKDYPLYRRLGLGGFQIDRGAGKADQVKLSMEQNFPYYVGHTAGKGWLYLTGENREKLLHRSDLIIRPRSLSDPEVISEMKRHMEKNIRDTRKGFVLAYAFDDEISLGRMTNPADADIHPRSVRWFREWLESEYRTIDALNRQWETEYADFGQVAPHGFESIRKRLDSSRLSSWNLSPWMDFRRFMDYQFAAVLAELTRHANGLDPDIPAGFVGGQPPSPWGGYDYAMLCRSVQWMEAYDIFSTDEILRSFWGNGLRPRMQTFFSTGDVKQDAWFLWYYLVQGNRGAVAWPEKWFHAGKNPVAPNLLKLRETFEAVQGEISEVILDSELRFTPDPVGIYYSHPSIQAGWVMDATVHGKTWPRRSTSLDNDNRTEGLLRKVWCKTLEDLGFQYDFISYLDVREGRISLNEKFRVIILPKTVCLSDAEADALKRFAENGGLLIADHLCGIMDGHGKALAVGKLDGLFGLTRNDRAGYMNGKGLAEIDGEKFRLPSDQRFTFHEGACRLENLLIFERGTQKAAAETGRPEFRISCPEGTPRPSAVMENTVSKGKAVYLNLSPLEYAVPGKRFSPYGKQWRKLISGLLSRRGLHPRVRVTETGKDFSMMETIFLEGAGRTRVCLIRNPMNQNHSDTAGNPADIQGISGNEMEIRMAWDTSVRLTNLRTGRSLGKGKIFTDRFAPWEANVYTVEYMSR